VTLASPPPAAIGPISDSYFPHICLTLQSKDQLTASDVVNNLTGKSEKSKVRDSS
jgi:hypothetical protein